MLAGSLLSTTAWTRQRRARPARPEPSNEGPRPRSVDAGGTRQERPQAAERLRGQLLSKATASTGQSQAWEPLSRAHVPVRLEPPKETAPAGFLPSYPVVRSQPTAMFHRSPGRPSPVHMKISREQERLSPLTMSEGNHKWRPRDISCVDCM